MEIWNVAAVVVIVSGALYLYLWYLKKSRGICHSDADLSGKTAIITGASGGIGYFTALDLAGRNARVILACRDVTKGLQAKRRISEETGNTAVVCHYLDVSSLDCVRKFVRRILREEARLDILVNNAGVTGLPLKRTNEGLEYMFATNHFGPFLLTNLLLDLLKKSAPSRIVNVSSLSHGWGTIEFDNLCAEKRFTMYNIYYNSKLANILFTRELSRRLQDTGVIANSLHPGTVNTQLLRHLPRPVRLFLDVLGYFLFKSPLEGAQTSIYCAVSEDLAGVSGKYFVDCRLAQEAENAQDDHVARKLWRYSEVMTGIHENVDD